MPKGTFVINPEHEAMLVEIEKSYGLSKSDSVRRGVELLYNYLIKDKMPDGTKIKPKDKSEEKSG